MPRTGPGHPGKAPRKTMTLRIDEDLRTWLYAYSPRSASISDFVNEAIREKIAGSAAPREKEG